MQACVYSYVATCKLIHVCNVCRYVAMYQGIGYNIESLIYMYIYISHIMYHVGVINFI